MKKSCHSCGMPFENPEDIAKEHQDHCIYCLNEDGKPKSYEEILDGCATYFSTSQGITKEEALSYSKKLLSTLPKWKNL